MDILQPQLFLCHSARDAEFVERLALRLTEKRINVWLDRWELRVGDSLLDKIQDAIDRAAYLGIVLSPASVESRWVKQELEAGLTKELEQKQVVVLPILHQDCEIPLFLRRKIYADFRSDFEEGFQALAKTVKPPQLPTSGHTDEGAFHHDYALDWKVGDDGAGFRMDIASHYDEGSLTVLAKVASTSNERAVARLKQIEAAGFPWAVPSMLLLPALALADQDIRVLMEDDQWIENFAKLADSKTGTEMRVDFGLRRLGELPDKDLVYDLGQTVGGIVRSYVARERQVIPPFESRRLMAWLRENPQ